MNLEKKSIALGVEAAGKRKAIEIVGKLLVQNRHIEPGYVESMMGRESVANTFLGNGISIPYGAARTDAGGKGVFIARLLPQFELPATVTGFLGLENPEIFEKLFAASDIKNVFVRVPGEIRVGIKILDSVSHTTTDLNLPGLSLQKSNTDTLFEVVEQHAKKAAITI